MDNNGILVDELEKVRSRCGTYFSIPPLSYWNRYPDKPPLRAVSWAAASTDRYIIEDDYDSEFRLTGKPIPSLQSMDITQKVIYINTFTKSLSSTMRISYMVLPPKLANRFLNG